MAAKRIQKIVERWFITEPALFQIYLTHNLEQNTSMQCPFRSGKGKVEYNPTLIEGMEQSVLQSHLMAEMIRILLKHPYDRQPDGCKRKSMSIGSDLVLADNYDFQNIDLPTPAKYGLKSSESYEWYSYRIEEFSLAEEEGDILVPDPNGNILVPTQDGDASSALAGNGQTDATDGNNSQGDGQQNGTDNQAGNIGGFGQETIEIQLPDGSTMTLPTSANNATSNSSDGSADSHERAQSQPGNGSINERKRNEDLSALWEEDALMNCTIDNVIDEIEASNGWGCLAGNIEQIILANTKAKIDYRKVLAGFRASVLSSKRHLTRMRPNRRSGFDNMGSIRRFDTNLLVAIDVSGSISDKTISHFYSIINRAFKYGIEKIDTVQFDTELKEVVSLEKKQKRVEIYGRGGTSFQPIFDYVGKHPEYDGLIILTDGEACKPTPPKHSRCKVVWVCNNKSQYERNHKWMKKLGRCVVMEI